MKFKDLPISGGLLNRMDINSSRRIHFEILTFPKNLNDAGRDYDLQFYTIVDFKLNYKMAQGVRIIRHDVFDSSPYLTWYKNTNRNFAFEVNEQEIRHYQLSLEDGVIDILAEGFTFTLTMETRSFIMKA